jgi:hypothetical protein
VIKKALALSAIKVLISIAGNTNFMIIKITPIKLNMKAKRTILLLTLVSLIIMNGSSAYMPSDSVTSAAAEFRYYRGNSHTHAKYSDDEKKNDVPEIAGWYQKKGYDFLLLSEHNDHLEKLKTICHNEASTADFLMICGLELSKKRHHTAFGISNYIGDEKSLQDGVTKTISAGGVAILNHPQDPVMKAEDFLAVNGLNHLEVFNGNRPEQTQATEKLWDEILSSPSGRMVYAVASDDNHYKEANAGRGWIMVKSPALTQKDIVDNIRNGNFYASTGVILKDYKNDGKTFTIDTENGSNITFIGKNGKILSEVKGTKATYSIKGDEKYIRIKISGDKGKMAWTQPVEVK